MSICDGAEYNQNYDKIRDSIENSKSLSSAEKAEALENLELSQKLNNLITLTKCLATGVSIAAGLVMTVANPFGWVGGLIYAGVLAAEIGALNKLLSMLQGWALEDLLHRLIALGFAWAIDPSGYVYNINTNEHIYGATVTAYWVPFDEEDTDYWEVKPGLDEYGVAWDSTEFSQSNPLTTDLNGWYAWDVPEGWWRVKSEANGYETTWSDWVPVPPPQMEVHIGMTPIQSGHEFKLGDVNHDGKINAKDATLILQKSVGVLKPTAKFCEDCAEVSGDGKLNAKDSTLILQFSVGLRDSFPAQEK